MCVFFVYSNAYLFYFFKLFFNIYRLLWDFINTAIGEINQLSDSVKVYPEKMLDLLKMSPSKR